jgi:hypothetical protein
MKSILREIWASRFREETRKGEMSFAFQSGNERDEKHSREWWDAWEWDRVSEAWWEWGCAYTRLKFQEILVRIQRRFVTVGATAGQWEGGGGYCSAASEWPSVYSFFLVVFPKKIKYYRLLKRFLLVKLCIYFVRIKIIFCLHMPISIESANCAVKF